MSVSVTELAATYLVYTLKTLCSIVMVTFAYHLCYLHFLISSRWTKEIYSDGSFSRRPVCRTNDSSYNLTDSSLVTVDYQQHFLACDFLCVKQNCWSGIHVHVHAWSCCILHTYMYTVITCNRIICILVVTLCRCAMLVQGAWHC